MKHFTRQYVENYTAEGKTKDQLRKDLQICSILLSKFELKPNNAKRLHAVGMKAMNELFKRYGDFALWSSKYINDLPDSAFMWVEKGGKKDAEGKTMPRSLRHLPFKNDKDKVDIPHVRNAISRLSKVKDKNGKIMPIALQKDIRNRLEKILETMKKRKVVAEAPSQTPKETAPKFNSECMECGMKANISGDTKNRTCSKCGGGFKRIGRDMQFVKEHYSASVSIHSIDSMEMSQQNPRWMELTGILFHRGIHKGIEYDDESLINAKLVPREGEKLCYVDIYHKKDEGHRVGILAEIWWDPKVAWFCPTNDMHGTGAIMYRSFITDKDTISDIQEGKVGNVSAELHFDTFVNPGDAERREHAVHVEVNGKAITPTPALKAADITEACTIDRDGKRSCQKLKSAQIK